MVYMSSMQLINSCEAGVPVQLDIRDLRLVVTIARTGSVTNAALALNLTQSTLSHHLAQLENRVNRPLFFRSGRRLTITPFGNCFRTAAEPILERIESMQHDLANGDSDIRVELRFATECYTTYPWFASIARAFKVRYPDVDLKLITEATARPLLELGRGGIDIAITSSRVRDSKLHVQELFVDELVAVVAKDHHWAAKKRIALEEFRNIHLLTYAMRPMDSDFVREVLVPAGIVPQKASGVQLTEALFEFARARLGVAVVAKWAVGTPSNRRGLVSIRIGQNGIQRSWKAVWLRNHSNASMLTFFAKLLAATHGTLLHK